MEVVKRSFPDKSGRLCFDSVEFLRCSNENIPGIYFQQQGFNKGVIWELLNHCNRLNVFLKK